MLVLGEFLQQTNNLKPEHHVMIIAATNRMEDLDPALLRRFQRKIHVG